MRNKPVLATSSAWLLILVFASVAGVLIFFAQKKPVGDFGNYYYGAHFLADKKYDQQLYDPYYFNTHVPQRAQQFLNYTPVPPPTAIFYLPLKFLNINAAKLVWNIFTALLFLFSLIRIFHFRNIDLRWAILVPLLFFIPLRSNIDAGQTYFLLFFLLAEGWLAMEKQRPFLAALCWAPAILLKIFPAIILLFLLLRKEWPSLILTVLMLAAMFGLSCIVIPFSTWKYYLTEILPRLSDGAINDPFAGSYQSMQVFLRKVFVRDAVLNPHPALSWPLLFTVSYTLFKAVVFFLAGAFVAQKKRESLAAFSVMLLAATLLSGYGSVYGLILLVFLVPAVVSSKWNDLQNMIFLLLLGVAVSIPVHLLSSVPLALQFPRLWLLILLLVLCIWQSKNLSADIFVVAISLLIGVLTFIGNRYHKPIAELVKTCSNPLLNGSLRIEKDSAGQKPVLDYFTEKGKQICSVALKNISSAEKIQNTPHGFSWQDKNYSFGKNLIRDVFFVRYESRESIVFLSDEGRGPGFYSLREINVSNSSVKR